MSNYKRLYIPGSMYFFTVVTNQRKNIFNNDDAIKILKNSVRKIKENYPFHITAIVILPNHLHCIWEMLKDCSNFSIRWQLIKSSFSKNYRSHFNLENSFKIWQRRFWEYLIRNETDLKNHLDYIHYNPMKHGYAASPHEWQHSSFKKFLVEDYYDRDWGENIPENITGLDFK